MTKEQRALIDAALAYYWERTAWLTDDKGSQDLWIQLHADLMDAAEAEATMELNRRAAG